MSLTVYALSSFATVSLHFLNTFVKSVSYQVYPIVDKTDRPSTLLEVADYNFSQVLSCLSTPFQGSESVYSVNYIAYETLNHFHL